MIPWLWMSAAVLYVIAFFAIGSSIQQLLLVAVAFTGGSVCLGLSSMIGMAMKNQAGPPDVGKLARTAPATKSKDAQAVEAEARQHRYAEAERQLKGRRQ